MKEFNIYTVFKGTSKEFTGNRSEIARHFGINFNTFNKRLRQGCTIEEAINWKDTRAITVFKNTNKEFTGTKREIAKHFNINYGTFKARLKSVYTIEQAIDWNGGKHQIYTVFKGTDKEFTGNKSQIAKHFELDLNYFYKILNKNSNIEDTILNLIKNKKIIYTVFKDTSDEFTGTLPEISNHFDISYNILIRKIKQKSLENAILDIKNENYKNKNFTIIINNKKFIGSKAEISKKFNIPKSTLSKKILELGDVQKAVDYILSLPKNVNYIYNLNDKTYCGNYIEICKTLHTNKSTVYSRLNNGMSIEEAIEIPLKQVHQKNLSYKGHKGEMKELCKQFNKNYIEVYNKVKYNHTFEWAMDSTNNPYYEGEN